ncbi:efflux RND transporter periplasmic adaptor subunit [Pseudodesulfovibrio pelocollis]|uniref:efflux RND transporter periplasmic adaptor subunit n=1 Tax=Pseudodesulfovibrio pelocollis TaxID=3051432 RepID=UPI00255B1FA2|nr:efflux RND transporter periplasmic adaptor subunit [Pseudodesulfovibrio sp. SB368]
MTPKRLILRLGLSLAAAALLVSGCGGEDKGADTKTAQTEATPMKVIKAETRDMPYWGEFIGQINAAETVDIRARVAGFLMQKNFKEGASVSKGDLLFIIDPRPFQETLKQEQSGLDYNLALIEKAQKDYERFKRLFDEGVVSRDEYESYQTQLATLKAQVSDNRARVENARIELGYTRIQSPIDGIIGRVQVDVGNLVGQGENTLLATVSTVDPVYVNFSVSESDYIRAMRDQSAKDSRDSQVRMVLADGSEYDHDGTFDMVDRAVDSRTGTLGVRVTFPNPAHILRPGQYAKVRVLFDTVKGAVVVPVRGVIDTQGMKSLLVVDESGTVRSQPVTLGFESKDMVIVSKGLSSGDMVIVDGIRRVRAGMTIKPVLESMDTDNGSGQPAPDAEHNATAAPQAG